MNRTLKARTYIARKLRRNATDTETILWRALRERMPDIRFRRQHPIGLHVVDFACPASKLAIEVDGGQHAEQQGADADRTAALEQRGYRVIRFWNNEVLEKLGGVLETIRQAIENSPSPPFRAEREGPSAEALGG
jgi:very-short-patch-repair endonuclease